ncbi:hypothetical protein F4781DRAFT_424242 [Annulohypoxylon bovei var. microspora]|nr:hypothetical protein F4781DRAFT_424242 [Annulohypoxylon bovei var. microspora]
MASPEPFQDSTVDELEGRQIIRRFTGELAGSNELERSTKAAQAQIDEEEHEKERLRLKLLYESGGNRDNVDFIASDIARDTLQKMVNKFIEEEKPSVLQRMGIPYKSAKQKTREMLRGIVESDVNELKSSVDNLDEKWKENNGPVFKVFKKLCKTLDDHKSIFSIFPSQNEYTSVLCSSISCLVKAAKNHSEISEMLSDSITRISEKVARASKYNFIFKTQAIRLKLADIYAIMFDFYYKAIKWYLDSKIGRAFHSFNENLKSGFESTKAKLNEEIEELYREGQICNHAMVAVLYGKFEDMTTAGYPMLALMKENWRGSRPLRQAHLLESPERNQLAIEPAPDNPDQNENTISLTEAREYIPTLEGFIVGDEGPGHFSAGSFWVAEDAVLPKLRAWMTEGEAPRTLWISSPYEPTGMTSARASALAVVAAAWQAKAPLISHFCKRPQQGRLRTSMSVEQVGLMGLVYSLVCQLLQFSRAENALKISEESLRALNGEKSSWEMSLEVLEMLLTQTPVLTYCVIDGLNDLELADGSQWCVAFLRVLFARQKLPGTTFNILLTTAGQSQILASGIKLEERHLATKPARELVRRGQRIELQPPTLG